MSKKVVVQILYVMTDFRYSTLIIENIKNTYTQNHYRNHKLGYMFAKNQKVS